MSLVPIFGKYLFFFASLGTGVGMPLVYSSDGAFLGGGGSPIREAPENKKNHTESPISKLKTVSASTDLSTETNRESLKVEISSPVQSKSSTPSEVKQTPEKEDWTRDIPTPKGEESKKMTNEQVEEFLKPFLNSLETPTYYRGYMNFINKVRMTLPKDTINKPNQYWKVETTEEGEDRLVFNPNVKKVYPKIMQYRQVREDDQFKELALQAKKWFKDWNKPKDETSEEFYDAYYEIKKGENKTEVIFWRYFKDKWYSFELEYAFDITYSGPVLQLGYVWYKDSNWWGGGYYQAEGGRGYQRHIGATNASLFGNPTATINSDFISTFRGGEFDQFVKWWKIIDSCSKDQWCRATLQAPSNGFEYIKIPLSHYSTVDRDKWSDYHPFTMKYREVTKNFKKEAERFKHINSIRGIQR